MKILAIIPARAGSKGIPNKNIRIIGGHPMIYYSIKNACDSKFIDNVVVSTDSAAIRIIASQMGAKYIEREKSLCEDDVTLDAVIYDVMKKCGKYDYIVTMQPTSPNLSVDTLDRAIQYTIDNELDTVISVRNEPHLAWGEKDGKKVPLYTERVNRQYLPAHYNETGAFVISRADVVTDKSRIGEKVDIFEVPENESIDIDTFSDLQVASTLMDKDKVAIYVNGNNKRGVGHVYRALEMADEFYSKPDIYYDTNQTDPKIFGQTTHKLIPVNGIADLFERCKEKHYTIFINDILTTSIDYMIGLRTVLPNAKIINFEDEGEGTTKADLVINALFGDENLPQIFAGEQYFIAGKLFMFYNPIKINLTVNNIFICFGGADPQNYTDRILNIVSKNEYQKYNFIVALGRSKYNIKELLEYNKYPNIDVFYDVPNMPELMSKCDIGITSRGRTGYELAILGIPSIAMAQNKREETHGFVNNQNGFSYIGLNPTDDILENTLRMYISLSKESRQQLQNRLLSHNLKGGRRRVMKLIQNL